MSAIIRVTGAWTSLAMDWLTQQGQADSSLCRLLLRYKEQAAVPLPHWQQALTRCSELPGAGGAPELAIGAGVKAAHVGMLGYLILASDTLGDALLAYQRYERLFYGVNLLQLNYHSEYIELFWPPLDQVVYQLADGVAIAALVTLVQQQLTAPQPPLQLCFRGSVAAVRQTAYQAFFGCPVLFEQPRVAVRFNLSLLQSPMPLRDARLRQLLDRQLQHMLPGLADNSLFEQQLQQVLFRLLVAGEATLQRAAAAMHMSSRTLQRRLLQHGVCWQQWLDSSRAHLANHYFADTALSISDIALLLGFSEHSAFTRAYRRWTGQTPAQYRRLLKRRLQK